MATPHLPLDYDAPELSPAHLAEWTDESAIDPDLARLNVVSYFGDTVLEMLIGDRLEAAGGHAQQYATGEIRSTLHSYESLKDGGWWCSGVDLQNGCNALMTWGLFKPDHPRTGAKGRTIKYEHPYGQLERLLALQVPANPNYWAEIKADPSIAIVLDEGAKKAAAWLTAGIPAICLPGIWAGTPPVDKSDPEPRTGFGYGSKATTKTKSFKAKKRELHPDLIGFAKGRTFYISLDYETDANKIYRRDYCTRLLTEQLYANGAAKVLVCHREGPEKGSDDLLLAQGSEALHDLLKTAEPANLPPINPSFSRSPSTLLSGDGDAVEQVATAINDKLNAAASWAYEADQNPVDARVLLQLTNIPGLGKSHLVPQLGPRLLMTPKIDRVIYVSDAYRSPSISDLNRWAAPPSRHSGLVVETIQGQQRLRRRKATDNPDAISEPASCVYSNNLQRLRDHGASTDATSGFCYHRCPQRLGCRYIEQRQEFQHGLFTGDIRLLRCSVESLSTLQSWIGKDGWTKTFLIFDEAPQLEKAAIKTQSIPLDRFPHWATWIRNYRAEHLDNPHATRLIEILDTLAALPIFLDAQQQKFGAGLIDITTVIGAIPQRFELEFLKIPELDTDPSPDHDTKSLDITTPHQLPALLDCLRGTVPGSSVLYSPQNNGNLELIREDLSLLSATIASAGALVLDGTANIADIRRYLHCDLSVAHPSLEPIAIKTAHTLKPASVEIIQIGDLGALGRNRGADIQKRLTALLPALQGHVQKRFGPEATTGVIEKSHFRDRDSGHGIWFVDNQGSNAFEKDKALIMVGLPSMNLTGALARFQATHHQRDAHLNAPDFRAWYSQRMGEQIIQGIHRLRPIRREGETLLVFMITDADLSGLGIGREAPLQQLPSGHFTKAAAPKRDRTKEKVIEAIWTIYRQGTPEAAITTRRVAEVAGCTHTTARRQAAERSWGQFVSDAIHTLTN